MLMSTDLSKVHNNLPASSRKHIYGVQGAIGVYYLKFKGSLAGIRQRLLPLPLEFLSEVDKW